MIDLGESIVVRDWNCLMNWFARKAKYLFATLFFVSSVVPYAMGVWGLFVLDSWWLFVVGSLASFGVLLPVLFLLRGVLLYE